MPTKPKPTKKSANRLIKSGRLKFDKTFLVVTMAVVIAAGGYLLFKGTHAATVSPPQIYNLSQFPTLQQGSVNYTVVQLRVFLAMDEGKLPGGFGGSQTFDSDLAAKVRAFQTFYHLNADGIVGPQTWTTILQVNRNYIAGIYGGTATNPNATISSAYGGILFSGNCPTSTAMLEAWAYDGTPNAGIGGASHTCTAAGQTAQISSYLYPALYRQGTIATVFWLYNTHSASNIEYFILPKAQ